MLPKIKSRTPSLFEQHLTGVIPGPPVLRVVFPAPGLEEVVAALAGCEGVGQV